MCATTPSCLDLSTPPVENTVTDAPTLDFANRKREIIDRDLGGTPAISVSSSATLTPVSINSSAAAPSARTLHSSVAAPSSRTLGKLKRLDLFTEGDAADVAHLNGCHNFVEYTRAATNTQLQSRSEGKKVIVVPNIFKEATRLPEAQQWQTAMPQATFTDGEC